MKTIVLAFPILILSLIVHSQDRPVQEDTSFCELYFCLNDQDAINYSFKLYLNNIFITELTHGTRLICKITSMCEVRISDNNHKPFTSIQAKPGSKFYFRIWKSFGGKYFKLEEYQTETEVQEYLHFYFWEKYYKYGGPSLLDQFSNSNDQGTTLEISEDPSNPLCTKNR